MECREVGAELVNYIKDELTVDERPTVSAHLASCDDCQRELAALQQTFSTLQAELVPIELSAHFRVALADRLDEATRAANQAATTLGGSRRHLEPELEVVRASERYRRNASQSLTTKFWEHIRRSPYFAVSLVAHAAAVVLVVFLFMRMANESSNRIDIDDGGSRLPVTSLAPHRPPVSLKDLVQIRKTAISENVHAMRTATTVRVRMVMGNWEVGDTLFLTASTDTRLPCLLGLLDQGRDEVSRAELRKNYPRGITKTIQGTTTDSYVDIPRGLAMASFGNTLNLKLFYFNNRIEFWTDKNWRGVQTRTLASSHLPRHEMRFSQQLCAAILPRRESL